MLPVKAEATALYQQEALSVYKDLELNRVNRAYPHKRWHNAVEPMPSPRAESHEQRTQLHHSIVLGKIERLVYGTVE